MSCNASLPSAKRWTFAEYSVATGPDINPLPPGKGPPNFVPAAGSCTNCGNLEAYGANGSVVIAFAVPGVYFWAVRGSA